METRASHIAVGAFELVLLVGLLGFVAWVARYTGQETYAYYDILYSGDVTGLNIDGPVRYRGIPVGRVVNMEIDPQDFDQIRITVEVLEGTPLREDSYATIEPQGITGVLYVIAMKIVASFWKPAADAIDHEAMKDQYDLMELNRKLLAERHG